MAEGTNPANVEKWKIDGVDHLVGLRNVYVNEKGNLNLETSEELGNTNSKGNINVESMKNIQLKPGGKGDIRLQVDHLEEDADGNPGEGELNVRILNSSVHLQGETEDTDAAVALKINTSEITITNKDTGTIDGETKVFTPTPEAELRNEGIDVNFNSPKVDGSKWSKARFKASSVDIRCNASKQGTGGGIAVQIASCDSDYKENKFKIETDRLQDVMAGQADGSTTGKKWADMYNGKGGDGIEIGTINSQFESMSTKELRRLAMTEVFAVKRKLIQKGTLKFNETGVDSIKDVYYDTSASAGVKTSYFTDEALETNVTWPQVESADATFKSFEVKEADYETQNDDSKDIKLEHDRVLWADIINAVLYLKSTVEGFPNNDDVTNPDDIEFYTDTAE